MREILCRLLNYVQSQIHAQKRSSECNQINRAFIFKVSNLQKTSVNFSQPTWTIVSRVIPYHSSTTKTMVNKTQNTIKLWRLFCYNDSETIFMRLQLLNLISFFLCLRNKKIEQKFLNKDIQCKDTMKYFLFIAIQQLQQDKISFLVL